MGQSFYREVHGNLKFTYLTNSADSSPIFQTLEIKHAKHTLPEADQEKRFVFLREFKNNKFFFTSICSTSKHLPLENKSPGSVFNFSSPSQNVPI